MTSGIVIIIEKLNDELLQVAFVQDDDVIEQLAAEGADKAFDESVFPRRPGSRGDFLDAKCFEAARDFRAIDAVVVADEITGRFIEGECLFQLQCDPCRVRLFGDGEVNDAAAVVAKDQEDVEVSERDRWHSEEID